MRKLLFVSNLFPDAKEPYRGLDNVTVLHELRRWFEVRVISPRPWLPVLQCKPSLQPRAADEVFAPEYLATPYLPKVGGAANHVLMARALRAPLQKLRSDFEWDVVMSSWLFPDTSAVAMALGENSEPLVAIAQGSDVHRYLRSPLRRRAILSGLARSSACITRSNSLAIMLGEAGVAASKLVPIHNGINRDHFSLSAAHPVPQDERVLLFVGNLLPVKDPLFLVQCFAELAKRRPQDRLRLVVVGKGPLEHAVRAEADRLGVGPQVSLTGPLDAADVGGWMRSAELLCMTSRNEGLPNVVLEAQACGLPVVATNVGGILECVDADWKGALVPLGDAGAWIAAVERFLDVPADRQRIANIGAARHWAAT
ncbi:MAG: glycosyltransferase, partial [Verrucomicrobiales bacterium]|nr:glycosyltransferase [Verrucomicrobiales bacterium]